jgi:hypothetical protein
MKDRVVGSIAYLDKALFAVWRSIDQRVRVVCEECAYDCSCIRKLLR